MHVGFLPADEAGGWNSDGCFVRNSTANETLCSCNHLTSFAILLVGGQSFPCSVLFSMKFPPTLPFKEKNPLIFFLLGSRRTSPESPSPAVRRPPSSPSSPTSAAESPPSSCPSPSSPTCPLGEVFFQISFLLHNVHNGFRQWSLTQQLHRYERKNKQTNQLKTQTTQNK